MDWRRCFAGWLTAVAVMVALDRPFLIDLVASIAAAGAVYHGLGGRKGARDASLTRPALPF